MTNSLDFILLPIHRQQGIDQSELPGLFAASPPRRAGRGRAQDRLVMHLALQGNAPLSPKAQNKLLDSLAKTYFKAAGSSTAAMRVVAESLNQSLFSRNQRGSSRGMRSLGLFTLAVFRDQRLYLAQCGAVNAFLVQAHRVQHFYDPSAVGRGLGMGRATPIQYQQAEVAPGDYLIISATSPQTWSDPLLRSLHGQPLERVHPSLLSQAGTDLEAVLVQIASGNGQLRSLRPKPLPSNRDEVTDPQLDILPSKEILPPVAQDQPDISDTSSPPEVETSPSNDMPQPIPKSQQSSVVIAPASDVHPKPQKTTEPTKRKPFIGPALLTIGRAIGTTLSQFFSALGTMFRRILPDQKILDLPPTVMLFGAIAVPLVIVTVASMIYFREGRGRLHQELLLQAQVAAEQALPLEDPIERRAAWEQVLDYLNQAEEYGSTEDSQALRTYSFAVLDELDIVERLDYSPGIVRGLPQDVTVSKIVVSPDNELYMLNEQSGYVLRATYTDQGYELDPVFNCGPIPAPLMVGPLIDIGALPLGEEDGATLLGMDSNGTLLRCIPGEGKAPLAMQMAPPDINWGEPKAFAYDNGNIYVLDPQTNAVWIYWGIDGYQDLPSYYFGNQVPPLQSVIDMTVSDGDLYLLHDNGRITLCSYSPFADAPTRCADPADFIDLRAGYQSGPDMRGANFQQIQFAPPPDPSIYLFDPADEAVYHLSMRLAFQRQYRPSSSLSGEEIHAFAVGPNRRVFIATEDQVYYAILP